MSVNSAAASKPIISTLFYVYCERKRLIVPGKHNKRAIYIYTYFNPIVYLLKLFICQRFNENLLSLFAQKPASMYWIKILPFVGVQVKTSARVVNSKIGEREKNIHTPPKGEQIPGSKNTDAWKQLTIKVPTISARSQNTSQVLWMAWFHRLNFFFSDSLLCSLPFAYTVKSFSLINVHKFSQNFDSELVLV